jgi:hypothetical protein
MASPLRRTLQQTVHDGAIKSIMFAKKVQLKKNEIRLSTSINYFYTLKKAGYCNTAEVCDATDA